MTCLLISPDMVETIHDAILSPAELKGRARDKSLEGPLARVHTRLVHGLIGDRFDLASACAVAIAQGQSFNDGNKRTAFRVMFICFDINGIQKFWDTFHKQRHCVTHNMAVIACPACHRHCPAPWRAVFRTCLRFPPAAFRIPDTAWATLRGPGPI